jgi:hypothetical protein
MLLTTRRVDASITEIELDPALPANSVAPSGVNARLKVPEPVGIPRCWTCRLLLMTDTLDPALQQLVA